jgi:glutamate formiminotransferase/glutamate formiminotransferase/formiminotetrahydrofolate cyclodeaminase
MSSWIECVANFSEGRNRETIEALACAAESVAGAALLDRTSDVDHNRTVLTIAGTPPAVAEAAFRAIETAVSRIVLPAHQGVHPRIGAADVVPFVPIENSSLEECARIAVDVAARCWREFRLPAFLYEAASRDASRARLEVLRSAKFKGEPDFGEGRHPTAGAVIVGARNFLVAWNINLDSQDLHAAREIARAVRESGGGLKCVKSLGLELQSRGQVQVSINLTDFEATPIHVVFERVREEAMRRNIRIAGSELIGLIPERALEAARGHDLQWLAGEHIRDYVLEKRLHLVFPRTGSMRHL